jgi:uncharacterized protein
MYMEDGKSFEWDKQNTEHIARHDVTPEEAEQALSSDPIELAVQIRNGEERVLCAGWTNAGRMLQMVYTVRSGRIRVVTAHAASRKLRRPQ